MKKRAYGVPSNYRLDAYVYFTANGILAFENIHSNLVAFPYLLKLDAYNQFTTLAAPIRQP